MVFANTTISINLKMKYYKRQWNEIRGDECDDWGTSIWYFEIDEKGYPNKQIEKYESGIVLKYDDENSEDKFGRLSDQPIDLQDFQEFEITKEEFDKEWK